MGVFYDVRAHIADAQDDYVGKKGSTVCLGIRKVKIMIDLKYNIKITFKIEAISSLKMIK